MKNLRMKNLRMKKSEIENLRMKKPENEKSENGKSKTNYNLVTLESTDHTQLDLLSSCLSKRALRNDRAVIRVSDAKNI